ncbi:MAG: hypothetical protein U5Q16_02525 [Gammaproteobacteria bacterium]|nr:hypothetical protein [Gammaproteobacteria bacterium]
MKALTLTCILLFVTGCVTRLDGQVLDQSLRDGRYYVERQVNDDRNLNAGIAEELRKRGIDATAGEAADKPDDAAYTVNYIDRWYWDMRMYLIDLRIEVRDRNSTLVGYGESRQTSLAAMGKTHTDIINRALDQMLEPE